MFDGRCIYQSETVNHRGYSVFIKNVSILLSPQYGKLLIVVCAKRVYVYFWKVGVALIYCTHKCVLNISLFFMWKS